MTKIRYSIAAVAIIAAAASVPSAHANGVNPWAAAAVGFAFGAMTAPHYNNAPTFSTGYGYQGPVYYTAPVQQWYPCGQFWNGRQLMQRWCR